MSTPKVLIACVGNIFLGDDGFGVEVARRLASRDLPEGVRFVDFGIRGLDLAYAFLDDWAAVVLVDAVPNGSAPGTLHVLSPDSNALAQGSSEIELHSLDPVKVLRLVSQMGKRLPRLVVLGCEPEPIANESDMCMGLSPAVEVAVGEAVELVGTIALRLQRGDELATTASGNH
jgi:hydrogenase maturation protease